MAAQESGKGVALVILGIVAIIAIVGLVLLFTGARKATGEFAVPAAKEYGGAIRGVMDPYSRAFSGRAREFPSGNVEPYSAQWPGSQGVMVGGEAYGDTSQPRGEQYDYRKTYERSLTEIPSKAACQFMAERSNKPQFGTPASVEERNSYVSMGRSCVSVEDLASEADRVAPDAYGRTREVLEYAKSIGVAYCCENPGLEGTI